VGQIQPDIIAQRRDEHLRYVKIAGGESIAGPVLAGKEAEAGAAVAIERLARTVAEDRITSPFGRSSSLSGLAGGRLSQAPGRNFPSKIWLLLLKPTSGRV
jgi:hypothetical protein